MAGLIQISKNEFFDHFCVIFDQFWSFFINFESILVFFSLF